MFQRDRAVPKEWQEDLDRLRLGDRVNWLKIVWQPGEEGDPRRHIPARPVQRWEIYEMIPVLKHVPDYLVEACKGEDPRKLGQWIDTPEGKVWDSDALVSRMQWDLFQQTGCYSQRFWIIQGHKGGHKWRLSEAERGLLQNMGVGGDTPLPGDLPYAEYDQRVFTKIARGDRLMRWRMAQPWDDRQERKTEAGLWVRRDRHDEEQQFQQEMYDWLMDQIEEVVSEIPRSLLPDPSSYMNMGSGPTVDEGALEEELITLTPTEV